MTKDAQEIVKMFDLIYEACNNIKDHEQCEECPLRNMCLEEEVAIDFIDTSMSRWDEFLDYADNVEFKEADRLAQYADWKRDVDREERMIDDEYGR